MIAIYKDARGDYDPDDYYPVALYDNGQWLAGGDEWDDYYPSGTSEEVIAEQMDGPTYVGVEVTEAPDELLDEIEKSNPDASMDVSTDVENDTDEEDDDEDDASIGPPQASLLGVGDDVDVVERADGERVYVDSVHEAPDDKTVHVETVGDDPDADKKLYYEP